VSESVSTAARFSGRVDDYARYRPSYPDEAIDAVLSGMGDPRRLVVVDVGAGTGIGAGLLAARGVRLIAIEPNPEMRDAASEGGFDVRDGVAERTGLADASADIVASFQAFHWFANAASVREFVRILLPGGRVALVWNVRDERDAFTRGYGEITDREGHVARGDGAGADYDAVTPALLAGGCLRDVRRLEFPSMQVLDVEALLGRARSASYVPRAGADYEAVAVRLTALHARHADASGLASLWYRTCVHLGEKPA
jgi:SAM-dependent methyltransferase